MVHLGRHIQNASQFWRCCAEALKLNFPEEPIFVVCHARSGSTLLRYLLDTHDDIVCPPELHLPLLLEHLARVYRILYTDRLEPSEGLSLDEKVRVECRRTVDRAIHDACRTPTKRRWCEKSVLTADHLQVTTAIYPGAHFLCLYRHCMDFVHSALEVISRRWGFGYGYESFISNRRNHDVADSLALFWCEKTEAILKFQRCGQYKCLDVKYESLAASPADTSRRLFDFLRVDHDDSIVERVFSTRHQVGPGDPKILQTHRIHADSIGTGRNVDAQRLSPTTRARMNALLAELGYEQVGNSWNARAG